MARLRIGSRGSQLALWQANHISMLLRGQGHEVQIEVIKTTGDKITDVALAQVGTKGMFTKEIEEALAGLNRLGKKEFIRQVIPVETMCPAAGQGALAIEIRAGDAAIAKHIRFLDNETARISITCERALLKKLGGGCQVPIGAFAEVRDGRLHLQAVVAHPDGTTVLRESRDGSDPVQLGELVGDALLQQGGQAILDQIYGRGVEVPQQP